MRRVNFTIESTLAALAVALSAFGLVSSLAAQTWESHVTESKPKSAVAALGDVDWEHWDNIEDLLIQIHSKTGIPAIAAACVKDGRIIDHATVGLREYGKSSPVQKNDPFHLGSVTKSMTAMVIGKLVGRGVLSWNTRLGDVLDDLGMREEYRAVTIENLLHHRGGLPSYTERLRCGIQPSTRTKQLVRSIPRITKTKPS